MASYYPRRHHIQNPFSARYEFIPEPVAPEPVIGGQNDEEQDEIMMEKMQIIETREKKLAKKGPVKNSGLPGQRLLKKLAKQQQLEMSLARVVKTLH